MGMAKEKVMINKAIIVGNLGQDPEKKVTENGITITTFSVATTEKWKDKNSGENIEQTEWHRVVTFRRLAEICADFLRKGSKVYIEGKLQTRSWEKDGIKRYSTEIVAQEMKMLDSRSADNLKDIEKPESSSQVKVDISDPPF
jgi:single-strand DNA-binding protein